jgi:hypothetical protein
MDYEYIRKCLQLYCDMLPGNVSVICGFWILCSVYWINRQAELQLIITLSILL